MREHGDVMATKKTTRKQKDEERITLNPAVLGGKPTIRGMRISVEQVLRALGNGITTEALLEDYPVLERQDIEACMLYAANLVEADKMFLMAGHEDSR